jgi:flagellar biosynthesis/type III secretory pathway protein FliH
MEKGMEKGRKEGIQAGALENQRKTILQARQMGMDTQTIATLAGLSLTETEQILREATECK